MTGDSGGPAGATGVQGVTGITFKEYIAGDIGWTGLKVDWNNGLSQLVNVIEGGDTGLIYMSGGSTGSHGTVRFEFSANEAPGFTGVKWSEGGTAQELSGDTGSVDIFSFYIADGYYAVGSLDFRDQA